MSAESVVYYLNRVPESDPNDQTEWLLTALGQYTGAELRELLYVAEEPGFFELMRGLFALSDESRHAPPRRSRLLPEALQRGLGELDRDPTQDRHATRVTRSCQHGNIKMDRRAATRDGYPRTRRTAT